MIETHPFGDFVPVNAQYLLLGSFTGQRTEKDIQDGYDWFYGTKRNQFWPLLEMVYERELKSKKEKQELCRQLGLAISDIILSCERKENSNLDMNLTNIVFNIKSITDILEKQQIKTIFFSSRFVEKLFKKHSKDLMGQYPTVEFITLPSPSPRYAAMSRIEKVAKYRELLPKL